MKKIFVLITSLLFVFSTNIIYATNSFIIKDEIKNKWSIASEWAVSELNKAMDNYLIPMELDEKDFTKDITRAEYAAVAVKLYERMSGKMVALPLENPFVDTENEDVLKALSIGVTNGTSATTFEPNFKISREQMATMMARLLVKLGIDTSVNLDNVVKFDDDDLISDWAVDAIYYMSQKGIIKGVERNHFDPTGKATREQALLISNRCYEKLKLKRESY